VHAGSAGADHRLHQFECIENAAETRFCVGDDRRVEIDAVVDALRPLESRRRDGTHC
jgi:hypothetical protein